MDTTKNSTTPWELSDNRRYVFAANGDALATFGRTEDAAMAVEAVNSHASNLARIAELEGALGALLMASGIYADFASRTTSDDTLEQVYEDLVCAERDTTHDEGQRLLAERLESVSARARALLAKGE